MASNYKVTGTDLDNFLEPRTGTKRADVNYHINGVDISNTYETMTRDQRIPDIQYHVNGTDLARLFSGSVSQYSNTRRLTSTRTTQWRTQLIHDFSITFSSATARTNFFTYGGRIIWSGSRSGGSSSSKNTDWTNLLNAAGTIELGKTNTYQNVNSTVSSIGSDDLTTSWQSIYTRTGTGVYSTNNILIQAYAPSSTQIRVRALYRDGTSGVIDEYVDGTIQSFCNERRHSSQAAPTYATITNLTSGS